MQCSSIICYTSILAKFSLVMCRQCILVTNQDYVWVIGKVVILVGWRAGQFFRSIFTSNITGKLCRTSLDIKLNSGWKQRLVYYLYHSQPRWPSIQYLYLGLQGLRKQCCGDRISPQHQFSAYLGGILSYSKEKIRDFRDEIKIP